MALLGLGPGVAVADARAPLDGRAMWIWYLSRSDGGNLAAIAARAHSSGVTTLIVKSGDGSRYWPQFSPGLVAALHVRGLRVCAWQYVYGTHPAAEAATAARAVRAGAECLVIDAEAEYQSRYAAAQTYLRRLRAVVGRGYLLGLASFPYVDYHPGFPYSVFLGPGGAQFDLPQMYWRDIGAGPGTVFAHTYAHNHIYRRAILPVGQSYGAPPPAEIGQFRGLTVRYRARGISWWDYAWTSAQGLWSALSGAFAAPAVVPPVGDPVLRPGARGDEVLWMQEHLARALPAQATTGLFGPQTLADLRAFQARRRLPVTGRTDAATWRALLRLAIVPVLWTGGLAQSASRSPGGRSAGAPASAGLGAVADEIPELGSERAGGADPATAAGATG